MLGNDRARIDMAHSLMLTLPGIPVLRYGDEIGMGEDLSLNERDSVRIPHVPCERELREVCEADAPRRRVQIGHHGRLCILVAAARCRGSC